MPKLNTQFNPYFQDNSLDGRAGRSLSNGSTTSSLTADDTADEARRHVEKLFKATDKNIDYVTNRTTEQQQQSHVFNASAPPSPEMHFYEARSPETSYANSRGMAYLAICSLALAVIVIVYLVFAEGAVHEALHPHKV